MTIPRNLRPALLLLVAATLAVYLPGLRNGFVWDDVQYVVDNPHVAGGLTAANARWALTAFHAGNWHPLTWLSHQLDVTVFGLAPWGPHLVNLLLHLANTLLLFLLLLRLTGAAWRSLLVAALFALHPLHVESVAWAAERKDVLSTLLGLLALHAAVLQARGPSPRRAALVALLLALGLAAKPMLVTLPFVMLLLEWWPLGRLRPGAWRRPLLEKVPLLALAAASAIVTRAAQASARALGVFPLDVRLSNAAVSYARYVGKTLAPAGLAAIYPHPLRAWPPWETGGAVLLLAATTALAFRLRRRSPAFAVGWLWYLGMLVPVIGLVPVGLQAMADRYTYLPAVGLFLLAAWGPAPVTWPRAWRPALAAASVAALLALGAASARQVGFWKDTETLFGRAAAVVPDNWPAHYNLGAHYQRLGRDDDAVRHYREAIRVAPDYRKALNNLGAILSSRGELAEAEALFLAAIRSRPDYAMAYSNLGGLYLKQGRDHEAEAWLRKAVDIDPALAEARVNLGVLALRQQRWREAEGQYAAAARAEPGAADARNGLGIALARQGRYAEAAAAFAEAQRLSPGDAGIGENLARAREMARGGRAAPGGR